MKKRTWEPLGRLEAIVMEVVWARAPVTAREVCDRMTGDEERAYTTIMTTMDRLHRKGLLVREKDGPAWRYVPALGKAEFEKALADSLAAEILQSHGEVALSAFVDAAAQVDEGLLDRLAQLISQRRKGHG
ncbi:BlaI/MecI/CopY family transcriptional regulator [Archangium lipolyticum]|uniref:BlaI/MecI/CopY family transcriptional regulator n=1 Tax=Archangium lipolyticum TaxID=2970465 RepID=UPI00214A10DA|nr:BlaI/MecI/CopY family transcriptional regulator [Archangium lipolyticum]